MSTLESLSLKIKFHDFFSKLNFNILCAVKFFDCQACIINCIQYAHTCKWWLVDAQRATLREEEINKLLELEKINLTEAELILLNKIYLLNARFY